MVRSYAMNYAGAFVLIPIGTFLYSWDLPTAGATPLDLLLFMAGSMWAVLSGIVPSPISRDLLHTDKAFSLLEQSEIRHAVTSLDKDLGSLVAGILAADFVADEKDQATLKGAQVSIPAERTGSRPAGLGSEEGMMPMGCI